MVVHSLVGLLQDQARQLADQAVHINQLRTERQPPTTRRRSDICERCGDRTAVSVQEKYDRERSGKETTCERCSKQFSNGCQRAAVTSEMEKAPEPVDRLRLAADYLLEAKSRYRQLAQEEEALQIELAMAPTVNNQRDER